VNTLPAGLISPLALPTEKTEIESDAAFAVKAKLAVAGGESTGATFPLPQPANIKRISENDVFFMFSSQKCWIF
jgi:hypothetical protein